MNTVGEKTPLSLDKNSIVDNGSISKDVSTVKDSEKDDKALAESGISVDEAEPGPMSFWRKVCFVLSFHTWAAYIVILAILIPCRDPLCLPPGLDWRSSSINASIITNLATVSVPGISSFAIFGYFDNGSSYLGSIDISRGRAIWKTTLNFVPERVLCHSHHSFFDANADGIEDCLVLGFNSIAAFNVSDGKIIWKENFASGYLKYATYTSGRATANGSRVLLMWVTKDEVLLKVRHGSEDYEPILSVLESNDGQEVARIAIPCDASSEMKLTSWSRKDWCLICQSYNNTGVWAFSDASLTDEKGSLPENSTYFQPLYQFSTRNIISTVPSRFGLAISWSNVVVMVASRASQYVEKWRTEISLNTSSGSTPEITNLIAGRFVDVDIIQIAVVVEMNSYVTVHFLDATNGYILAHSTMGVFNLVSLKRIPSKQGNMDGLLLEEMVYPNSREIARNSSSGGAITKYRLLRYDGLESFQNITVLTANSVYDSTFTVVSGDTWDELVLIRRASEGNIVVTKQDVALQNLDAEKSCREPRVLEFMDTKSA